jgi:uncharacterized membrane protein
MKTRRKMKTLRSILVMMTALVPAPLFACATCHGQSNSPLAYGVNAGIFTLMAVIVTVLAGIAVFFVHIVRKEEAQMRPPPQNPTDVL